MNKIRSPERVLRNGGREASAVSIFQGLVGWCGSHAATSFDRLKDVSIFQGLVGWCGGASGYYDGKIDAKVSIFQGLVGWCGPRVSIPLTLTYGVHLSGPCRMVRARVA